MPMFFFEKHHLIKWSSRKQFFRNISYLVAEEGGVGVWYSYTLCEIDFGDEIYFFIPRFDQYSHQYFVRMKNIFSR